MAVDRSQRSLTFAGDMPEGDFAQLMQANLDRLVDGAESAAIQTDATQPLAGDGLVVAISCVGRRLVLRNRIEEEVKATIDILPPGFTQVGFYSYGELSPDSAGTCELHNQTMTITTLSERPAR